MDQIIVVLSTHKPPVTLSLFSSELSMTAKEWCEYYWLMHHDVIVILIGNYDYSFSMFFFAIHSSGSATQLNVDHDG